MVELANRPKARAGVNPARCSVGRPGEIRVSETDSDERDVRPGRGLEYRQDAGELGPNLGETLPDATRVDDGGTKTRDHRIEAEVDRDQSSLIAVGVEKCDRVGQLRVASVVATILAVNHGRHRFAGTAELGQGERDAATRFVRDEVVRKAVSGPMTRGVLGCGLDADRYRRAKVEVEAGRRRGRAGRARSAQSADRRENRQRRREHREAAGEDFARTGHG